MCRHQSEGGFVSVKDIGERQKEEWKEKQMKIKYRLQLCILFSAFIYSLGVQLSKIGVSEFPKLRLPILDLHGNSFVRSSNYH